MKANVLFFDRTPPSGVLWVYDLRAGVHFTLKQDPLRREHLDGFVAAYRPGEPRTSRVRDARFRPYGHAELLARHGVDLDLTWTAEAGEPRGSGEVDEPQRLARAIVEDLTAALREFEAVALELGPEPGTG